MQQYSIPGLTEKKNTFPWFSCWWTLILGLFYFKNLEHKCLLSMSSSKNLQLETVPTFWPHAQRLMMTLRKVELNLDKDPNFGNIFTLPWLAQQASSWYLSSTKISQEANFLVLHISCLKKNRQLKDNGMNCAFNAWMPELFNSLPVTVSQGWNEWKDGECARHEQLSNTSRRAPHFARLRHS